MATKSPARRAGLTTQCVAIDLGATAVRVVEVEWIGNGQPVRVLRRGMATMSPEVWNDLPAFRDSLTSAVREALSTAGISSRTAVACLPRRLVTLRFAHLPVGSPEQMEGMVAYEAQQYIPFAIDDVVLDYRVLASGVSVGMAGAGEQLETVLIAAARRSLVAETLSAFERAGIELESLSVSALALSEHIGDALEATALIDVEPGQMDVAVVSDGQLQFTRATAFPNPGAPADVRSTRAVEEVFRSFTAYQNEFRQRALSHVHLSGVGIDLELLSREVGQMLDMPVERVRSKYLATADPEAQGYATVIGLAVQGMGRGAAGVNLVPNERSERKAQIGRRRTQTIGALIAGAAAVGVTMFVMAQLKSQAQFSKDMRAANQRLSDVSAQLDRKQQFFDRTRTMADKFQTGLDRGHPTVDLLAAVNHAMSQSTQIWLTQLSFERNGLITLRGNAKSDEAATNLAIRLQESGGFTSVRLNYLGDAQDDNAAASRTKAAAPKQNAPLLPGMAPQGGPSNRGNPGATGTPGGPTAGSQPPPSGIASGAPSGAPPGGFPGAPGQPAFRPGPGGMPPGMKMPSGMNGGPGGRPGAFPSNPKGMGVPRTSRPGQGPMVTAKASAPSRVVASQPKSAEKKAAKVAPKPAKQTPLSTFVITCQIDPNSKDLLAKMVARTEPAPGDNNVNAQ